MALAALLRPGRAGAFEAALREAAVRPLAAALGPRRLVATGVSEEPAPATAGSASAPSRGARRAARAPQRALGPPLARRWPGVRPSVPKFRGPRKWVLITLSGHTAASKGNDIWAGVAEVMSQAGANIEDAAATSMSTGGPPAPAPAPRPAWAARRASDGGGGRLGRPAARDAGPDFLCSAFYTQIRPHELETAGISLAVGVFFKVSMAEEAVPFVTDTLHRRFPRLVCTVTEGGYLEEAPHGASGDWRHPLAGGFRTGTMRLFGKDQPGQLAKITEVLNNCGVSILNLLVTTGHANNDTGEFIERVGGPLSENVVSVAVFDEAAFDESKFKRDVVDAATMVGYEVTSFLWDTEEKRAQEFAEYRLKRKAYLSLERPAHLPPF